VIFAAVAEGSSLPFLLLALPVAAAAVGAEHDVHLLHACYRMTEKKEH
jgi:hypothetical protein